jgi:Uma2 family endonuclease
MPQIAALLSEAPVAEYLDGERRRKVSPRSKHARVQALLVMLIECCGSEIGMAGTEWDFCIGAVDDSESFLVPDVAFLSFERLRGLERGERDRPPVAPDIAVEVWSPANDRPFLDRKIAKYLASGSSLVLDVDPRARTIVAHARGSRRRYADGERFEHAAVPWLTSFESGKQKRRRAAPLLRAWLEAGLLRDAKAFAGLDRRGAEMIRLGDAIDRFLDVGVRLAVCGGDRPERISRSDGHRRIPLGAGCVEPRA